MLVTAFLVYFAVVSAASARLTLGSVSSSLSRLEQEPFDDIGQVISRLGRGGPIDSYATEEVGRAVKTLAKSQSAFKSVDGLTHQFRNVVKERCD